MNTRKQLTMVAVGTAMALVTLFPGFATTAHARICTEKVETTTNGQWGEVITTTSTTTCFGTDANPASSGGGSDVGGNDQNGPDGGGTTGSADSPEDGCDWALAAALQQLTALGNSCVQGELAWAQNECARHGHWRDGTDGPPIPEQISSKTCSNRGPFGAQICVPTSRPNPQFHQCVSEWMDGYPENRWDSLTGTNAEHLHVQDIYVLDGRSEFNVGLDEGLRDVCLSHINIFYESDVVDAWQECKAAQGN
jgi:hypothetical protein